jgi:hypothetical protein
VLVKKRLFCSDICFSSGEGPKLFCVIATSEVREPRSRPLVAQHLKVTTHVAIYLRIEVTQLGHVRRLPELMTIAD